VASRTATWRHGGAAAAHEGEVACLILEPATQHRPAAGVPRRACASWPPARRVLIFDEMITGFRWSEAGAQGLYGVTPDLSTFGKALGNGFAVSALAGQARADGAGRTAALRERVFLLSTTHGAETHSLAAAMAVMDTYVEEGITARLHALGERLAAGVREVAAGMGVGTTSSSAAGPATWSSPPSTRRASRRRVPHAVPARAPARRGARPRRSWSAARSPTRTSIRPSTWWPRPVRCTGRHSTPVKRPDAVDGRPPGEASGVPRSDRLPSPWMVRPTRCLSRVAVTTAMPVPATTSTAARGRRSSRQPVTAATTSTAAPTGSPKKSMARATRRHGGRTLSAVGRMIHLSTLPGSPWPAYRTPSRPTTSAASAAIGPSRGRGDGGSTAGADRPVTRPPCQVGLRCSAVLGGRCRGS
jgi:hypothetical protein